VKATYYQPMFAALWNEFDKARLKHHRANFLIISAKKAYLWITMNPLRGEKMVIVRYPQSSSKHVITTTLCPGENKPKSYFNISSIKIGRFC